MSKKETRNMLFVTCTGRLYLASRHGSSGAKSEGDLFSVSEGGNIGAQQRYNCKTLQTVDKVRLARKKICLVSGSNLVET